MSSFRLAVDRGDLIRLEIACTRPDANGVSQPIDITSDTLWFTAKRNPADDDDAPTTIQKTNGDGIILIDGSAGTALVTIDPEETDALTAKTTFYCDVQLDEAPDVVTTVATGRLVVRPDITRQP